MAFIKLQSRAIVALLFLVLPFSIRLDEGMDFFEIFLGFLGLRVVINQTCFFSQFREISQFAAFSFPISGKISGSAKL